MWLQKRGLSEIVHIGVVNPYHHSSSLLFIEAGKNVLCEKPMGMNATEVKTMVKAAQEKKVFFMEVNMSRLQSVGFWSCFFPAAERICSLFNQSSIGDVMVFHDEFGSPPLSIPRCVKKELGGGGLLDIGCYCVQFACMVFKREKPESILASGILHDTGVDKTVSIILNYSGHRQAVLTCTMEVKMSNRASINGTKGMIEAIRWGICSAGKICHDFLVALKTLPPEDHKVVAIASRDLSRAQEYAKNHDIPKAYGSYEELAQDPDVDVVYVGVIHPYHLPATLLFIQAGKHVLCEKPLAMNAAEVKKMVQAAQKKKVFLMEALWTRFFPAVEKTHSLLEQRTIGDVVMLHVQMGVMPQNPQMLEKVFEEGSLLVIGTYCVHMACIVFNGEKPESILASGFLDDIGQDHTASILLNYSGQRQAVLSYTRLSNMPNRASISGRTGIIEIPGPFWCPTELVVNGQKEEFPLPSPLQKLNYPNSTGLRYEAEHVRQCLLQGLKESPIVSHAHSELAHFILDEIRRQLKVSYPQDRS